MYSSDGTLCRAGNMWLALVPLTASAVTVKPSALVSVYCKPSSTDVAPSCVIQEGIITKDSTATSTYNISTNLTTGFATLDIASPLGTEPRLAAYAAGYAEGYQTAAEIVSFYNNVYEFGPSGPSRKLLSFVTENDKWVRTQVDKFAPTSDYWMSVGTVLDRFDGLVAGYELAQKKSAAGAAPLPPLSSRDLLWVNLEGDLYDLQGAISEPQFAGRKGRAARGFQPLAVGNSSALPAFHCSSLFKLAGDKRELYFGHATWDTYATAAPRIFKHLTLPSRHNGSTLLRTVSMSSSPGFLASIDDYYLVREDASRTTLGVIETSVNIEDQKAYQAITPQSVLCWVRSMVANQLALSAPSWVSAFATHASGTYNNQWQVIDVTLAMKSTSVGQELLEDTFWVAEEVPGLVHGEDQSAHLNRYGYWPSFNVLFYPQTKAIAGATSEYTESVRYKIFEEHQAEVTSPAGMARMIAWNDYQASGETVAKSPAQAIMSRGDLHANDELVIIDRSAGGGIDAKYSTVSAAASGLISFGRAGPTNDDQPTFCWTAAFESTKHEGHPHCFDYKWGSFLPGA